MSHVYYCEEWETPTKRWHCGDVKDLANGSNLWWHPCNLLGATPADFVLLLVNEYNVSHITYNSKDNVLLYSWDNQADMRRFKNYINAKARQLNFLV
jgi:hypothetical protein